MYFTSICVTLPTPPTPCRMITNIGTLGLDTAYVPLVPYSRVPILIATGAVKDTPIIDKGEVVCAKIMTLLPFLLTLTTWRQTNSRLAHNYFLATCLLLLAMVPIMSGITGLDTHHYRGLIQRIFTLTVFPPIAVAAHILCRRLCDNHPQ